MDSIHKSPGLFGSAFCGDPHAAPFREGLRVCLLGHCPPPHNCPRSLQSQHFDGFVVEVWGQLPGQEHM